MEYASRNFPGHQTLVCTHPDGHNHSGNIHVHIVFNSLRKENVDRQPFMERDCDSKAGFKHHETKQRMTLLKTDLMDMCHRENLHQVDLLSPARTKVTDREYYVERRAKEKAEKSTKTTKAQSVNLPHTPKHPKAKEVQESSKTAPANNSNPSKFETQKDYLRRAIQHSALQAKSEKQFASILLQKYKVTLKISRGKYAYIHPGRTKPIRGRMLGTDFEETNLRKIFEHNQHKEISQPSRHSERTRGIFTTGTATPNKNNPSVKTHPKSPHAPWKDQYGFTHHGLPRLPKALTMPSDLKLVQNLQRSSKSYITHLANNSILADLNQLSKTVSYAQEHGFNTLDDIAKAEKQLLTQYRTAYANLEKAQARSNAINEKIFFTGLYRDSAPVYQQCKTSRDPEAYFCHHNITINNHNRARQYFRDNGIHKIPSLKELNREKKESVLPNLEQCKNTIASTEKALNEFKNMKNNINTLLSRSWERPTKQKEKPQKAHNRAERGR